MTFSILSPGRLKRDAPLARPGVPGTPTRPGKLLHLRFEGMALHRAASAGGTVRSGDFSPSTLGFFMGRVRDGRTRPEMKHLVSPTASKWRAMSRIVARADGQESR